MRNSTLLETDVDEWLEAKKFERVLCVEEEDQYRFYICTAVKPGAMRARVKTHFKTHVKGPNGSSVHYGGTAYSLSELPEASVSHGDVVLDMMKGAGTQAGPPVVVMCWPLSESPAQLHVRYWEGLPAPSDPGGCGPGSLGRIREGGWKEGHSAPFLEACVG